MSYYKSRNTNNPNKDATPKPTISKPQFSADCKILAKRAEDDQARINVEYDANKKQIEELTTQMQELQKQIDQIRITNSSLDLQYKKHQINRSHLTKWYDELLKQENQNSYLTRCKEYIDTYEWVNPNDGDDGDGAKNTLPSDIFSYLGLTFGQLDSYTSSEIMRIAHYIKASEIIVASDDVNIIHCYTYSDVINISHKYNGDGTFVIGDVTGCTCGYDNCSDSYKRYGDVLMNLDDITLDTCDIIMYSKRLYL